MNALFLIFFPIFNISSENLYLGVDSLFTNLCFEFSDLRLWLAHTSYLQNWGNWDPDSGKFKEVLILFT